jgi:DNA-directed RNA polymerase subunit H (RpoH/RPB5)
MNTQYNRYKNILTFAENWRGYKIQNKPLEADAFLKTMQKDQYIMIECLDTKHNKIVNIYLLDTYSRYATSVQDLKTLLKKNKDGTTVMLIMHTHPNTYSKKTISQYKSLNIHVYLHEIFDLILPNGPLCYPHRILSTDEALNLCNKELYRKLTSFPKIYDEDPQCIWIGAESGDIVEITAISDQGPVIHYRVVVPKSGKHIFAKESKQSEKEEFNDHETDIADVDETEEVDDIEEVDDTEEVDETEESDGIE